MIIRSDEFLTRLNSQVLYAGMLDMRRRILANSWARSAVLSGPIDPTLSLSWDVYEENGPNSCPFPYLSCTPMNAAFRDRVEIYPGWNYTARADVTFRDWLNVDAPSVRDTLTLPQSGSDSMHFPGMNFRFYSGPSVTYPATTRNYAVGPPPFPQGEGTGFAIDSIRLNPSVPAVRGSFNPVTLAAYERAMVVTTAGGEDSVQIYLDLAIARPTVAAWTQGGTSVVFANCGANPSWNDYDTFVYANSAGEVLDLSGLTCAGNDWRIAVLSTSYTPVVTSLRVGANTSAARNYNLIVGLEVAVPAGPPDTGELGYVRRVMRNAAWHLYGATGGTHIIRTFTYQNGTCALATVCFRNRSTCSPSAIMHPGLQTIDICRNITGFTPANDARQDSFTMAHEFGHLLTANGTANNLQDEYAPGPLASLSACQVSVFTNQCSHSLMADTSFFRRAYSLCTSANHGRVAPVYSQLGFLDPLTLVGARSVASGSTATSTVFECWGGTSSRAGPGGSAAWAVLASTGAAPLPHPSWSPDNHSYLNFAAGPSITVGRNMP